MPDGIDPYVVARAQKGDVSSVTAIYEHFHQSVFRYLFYRVGDRQSAEDLTSEVFLQMVRHLPGYKPAGAPFNAWLFRIARNLATDYFRKADTKRRNLQEERQQAEEADLPSKDALTTDGLQLALSRLGHDQRDVIILRFVAGLPVAEVAVSMNKSLEEVKVLQRRALASLHDVLTNGEVINDGSG
jgi:RNA polymerase sigma-70 factor (ECF subfamily)